MGILNKTLAAEHANYKKVHLGSVVNALSHPTGFDIIDHELGTVCLSEDNEEFLNVGVPMGKIMMLIGNSQGGKTTLALQIATNITKDLNGDVILADYERSSSNLQGRVRNITGMSSEEFKELFSVYNHPEMSTEFFKELIHDIVKAKKKLKKDDLQPWLDTNDKEILIYPPTVIILDSVPTMKPEEVLKEAKLESKMVASAMAAANSALLKSILHLLETYNITIIGINHITTKINTNAYGPRKVILPGLGEDENLPGETTLSPLVQ